jgi:undecaprenyl-diphosphatase
MAARSACYVYAKNGREYSASLIPCLTMHAIQNLNHTLFLLVNAGATTPRWWIDLAVFVANDLVYGVPVLLIGLWLAGGSSRRGAALLAFAIAMIALGANQLIGLAWYQPRPFVIGLGHTWASHVPDASFPSDHLTLFTSIGLGLLSGGLKRVGAATLVVGLLVGWARVYVGLHFPLDMAGSLLVAAACSAVLVPLWRHVGAAVTTRAEATYRWLFARPITRGILRA